MPDLEIEGFVSVVDQHGLNTQRVTRLGAVRADRAEMKGIYESAVVAVTVPTIADAEDDSVAVDVSSGFGSFQPAVGDYVLAAPQEALMTNALLAGAYVSDTDEITLSFGTLEGGAGVTGAAINFKFLVIDVT